MRPDLAGRLRLLAAGYAAEIHLFGVGLLNRATSDLEAAAEARGIASFELERDGRDIALSLYREYDPFRPGDAAVLVDLHNTLAQVITPKGGPDDSSSSQPSHSTPLQPPGAALAAPSLCSREPEPRLYVRRP